LIICKRKAVDAHIRGNTFMSVTVWPFRYESTIERCPVKPPGKGIQAGKIPVGGKGNMVIRFSCNITDQPSHPVRRCGEKNIQILRLRSHRVHLPVCFADLL
jgi:hypothetical protein